MNKLLSEALISLLFKTQLKSIFVRYKGQHEKNYFLKGPWTIEYKSRQRLYLEYSWAPFAMMTSLSFMVTFILLIDTFLIFLS